MKIYRHLQDGRRYHYYVEHEGITVVWYPEMTWKTKQVSGPEGRLLAQGAVERVLFAIRDVLPPDLLKQIRASLEGPKAGAAAQEAPGQMAL